MEYFTAIISLKQHMLKLQQFENYYFCTCITLFFSFLCNVNGIITLTKMMQRICKVNNETFIVILLPLVNIIHLISLKKYIFSEHIEKLTVNFIFKWYCCYHVIHNRYVEPRSHRDSQHLHHRWADPLSAPPETYSSVQLTWNVWNNCWNWAYYLLIRYL